MTAGHVAWRPVLASLLFVTFAHGRAFQASLNNGLAVRSDGNACGQELPSDWVCSSNSICLQLNNTGTQAAICCPASDKSRCSTVAPISCDISKQNATSNPRSSLFTQDLTRELVGCGSDSCCPLGYSCKSQTCVMDDDTKAADGTQSTTPTAASSSTSERSATSTMPSAVPASASFPVPNPSSPSQQTPVPQSSSNFPPQAVLAGFFPGIILGALICACIFFLLRRRTKARIAEDQEAEGEFGHLGHTEGGGIYRSGHMRPYRPTRHKHKISDPIYDHSSSNRSDFLKHQHTSPEMSSTTLPRTPSRNKRWHRHPRPGMGTWDSNVSTLMHPTPHRSNRPRLNLVTPTPPPRNALEHQHLTPSQPGLAVTTKHGRRVSNMLRPLSPSFQKARNFGTLSPRPKSPDLPPFQVPSQENLNPSRSGSNKSTTTTLESSSSSSRGHTRHNTDASTGTIDFLLAPHTGPIHGTFPLSESPPQPSGKGKGKSIDPKTPQRTPPRLGAPWQTPTIPESPNHQNPPGQETRPVTTFTTLMMESSYMGSMPAKAIRRN